MRRYVVDASVAIKWYIPENHSADAERLLSAADELHCPDLLFAEIGNILWKYVRRGECSQEKASTILNALRDIGFDVCDTPGLALKALDIACETNRTFYDSLYIALAVQLDVPMVTADLRLFNEMARTPLRNYVIRVEDVP